MLVSAEANWSGSTLFVIKYVNYWSESALFIIKYMNFYQKPGSNNLIVWKLEMGMAS